MIARFFNWFWKRSPEGGVVIIGAIGVAVSTAIHFALSGASRYGYIDSNNKWGGLVTIFLTIAAMFKFVRTAKRYQG